MRTKLVLAIILVLALAVTASMVLAQRGVGRGARGAGDAPAMMGGFGPRMIQALGLTPDQVTAMRQLHTEFEAATQADREALRTQKQRMMDLWNVDQPDAAQIKALADEMDTHKDAIRDTGIDYMVRGFNLLTPEQKVKARELMRTHGGKLMGGRWMKDGVRKGAGMGAGPSVVPDIQSHPSVVPGRGPTGTGCPMTK